ncbi:MAG: diacylglycerol kinase family protein [Oscillospiraceae bacterium]|nr:diacylglycerol kinase family protein [Oscillospiraceae bacterium]
MKKNFIKFFKGFGFAGQGIVYAVKTQQNFRFHLTAAVWVLLLSLFYKFTAVEYAVLFIAIGAVLSSELINTAVEKTVDLCTQEENKLAKAAKDVSAGAVLVSAVSAVCIAVCLFRDFSVITYIIEFMLLNPVFTAIAAVLAAGSVIFVFKGI